jgi:hypothetical protein
VDGDEEGRGFSGAGCTTGRAPSGPEGPGPYGPSLDFCRAGGCPTSGFTDRSIGWPEGAARRLRARADTRSVAARGRNPLNPRGTSGSRPQGKGWGPSAIREGDPGASCFAGSMSSRAVPGGVAIDRGSRTEVRGRPHGPRTSPEKGSVRRRRGLRGPWRFPPSRGVAPRRARSTSSIERRDLALQRALRELPEGIAAVLPGSSPSYPRRFGWHDVPFSERALVLLY